MCQVIFFFFFLCMLGNIELNVNTINNHLASYFVNQSFNKTVLLEIPDLLETLTMFPKV